VGDAADDVVAPTDGIAVAEAVAVAVGAVSDVDWLSWAAGAAQPMHAMAMARTGRLRRLAMTLSSAVRMVTGSRLY
jgi:hypothetical protein